MQPGGYLQLKDRLKAIIILVGMTISAIKVEKQLYRHPNGAMPSETWGARHAFVEIRKGSH